MNQDNDLIGQKNRHQAAPIVSAAPPNPFYTRIYTTTVNGGRATIEIPAPGGQIHPHDAQDIIDLFGLIQRQLTREINRSTTVEQVKQDHGDSVIRVGWEYVTTARHRPELKKVCTWPNGDEGFVFNESR